MPYDHPHLVVSLTRLKIQSLTRFFQPKCGKRKHDSGGKRRHFFVHATLEKGVFFFVCVANLGSTLRETNIHTYPTLEKGKSSSNMPYDWDMLVPWRVCQKPNVF